MSVPSPADGEWSDSGRERKGLASAAADEDSQSATLLYRDIVEYGVGHGVAAEWEPSREMRVDQRCNHMAARGKRERC